MSDKLKIAVMGANGRLGKEICDLCDHENMQLTAALVRPHSPILNSKIGSIFYTCDPFLPAIDVYIDVSATSALRNHIQVALQMKRPIVIGTTGLSEKDFASIQTASQIIPIFYSPNFSIGMAIFRKMIALSAPLFPTTTDIDLIETHHHHKKDAPSGSALLLQSALNSQKQNSISIHSIRSGNTIGKHELLFNLGDELLTFTHT